MITSIQYHLEGRLCPCERPQIDIDINGPQDLLTLTCTACGRSTAAKFTTLKSNISWSVMEKK